MENNKQDNKQQIQIPVQEPEQPVAPPLVAPPKELHGIAKLSISGLPQLDLLYDFNLLADTEELTGCNMLTAIGHLDGNMGSKELRALLFGLTRENHPNLTLQQVGRYLRIDTFADVFDSCWEACTRGAGDEYARRNLQILDKMNDLKAKQAAMTETALGRVETALLESTDEGLKVVSAGAA